MIEYAETGDTLVLRFAGEVRYTGCAPFNELIDRVFEEGSIENVLIDLTEASCIDSTGLGLLAKISNIVESHFHHKTPIFSTNPDINRTLDTVGFTDIFLMLERKPETPAETTELSEAAASDREVAETVLSAHRTLASLSEENWRQFKDVVSALEADLRASQRGMPVARSRRPM